MIVSPRAKSVIDIVRIEKGCLIEIDEVYLYRRSGEKVLYWKRGVHNIIDNAKSNSYCEWGDEIGEWGTELKKGEWGKLIPK